MFSSLSFFLLFFSLFFGRTELENSEIRTIYWTTADGIPSNAIVDIETPKILNLHFDVLTDKVRYLSYRFVHCDEYFQPDDLSAMYFVDGINQFDVSFPIRSTLTLIPYYHYEITLFKPGQDMPLLITGNYLLQVFDEDDIQQIIFETPIILYKNRVILDAKMVRPRSSQTMYSHQIVEVEVKGDNRGDISVFDQNRLFITAYQNNRWRNLQKKSKPSYYKDNTAVFVDDKGFVFRGLDEFYHADIRDLKTNLKNKKQTFKKQKVEVDLYPDDFNPYFSYQYVNHDLNGFFYISTLDKLGDAKWYGEYADVTFTLFNVPKAMKDNIYVVGGFNNWHPNAESKLEYKPNIGEYQCTLLLKQGYYDYSYIRTKSLENEENMDWLVNSFYQTKNKYQILVYYQFPDKFWKEIIGYVEINSNDEYR